MNGANIPAEAETLHQQARQHGAKGEYDVAIQKLKQANELAPEWAYPPYDLAYTYLLQQDFPNALKYYAIVDELEPRGFFTAKTALWSLRKEAAGEFPEGIYLAYMQIEWKESDEEKVQIAKAIVGKFPEYAPAWKVIAGKADSPEVRLDAVAKGLAADPDAETKGMLLINEALVRQLQGETAAAKQILGELVFAEGTTAANVEMGKFVLSTMLEE